MAILPLNPLLHSSQPSVVYNSVIFFPKTLLNKSFSYSFAGLNLRQCGHNLRASFCDIIPARALDNKYLSTSISSKRSIVFNELLV